MYGGPRADLEEVARLVEREVHTIVNESAKSALLDVLVRPYCRCVSGTTP